MYPVLIQLATTQVSRRSLLRRLVQLMVASGRPYQRSLMQAHPRGIASRRTSFAPVIRRTLCVPQTQELSRTFSISSTMCMEICKTTAHLHGGCQVTCSSSLARFGHALASKTRGSLQWRKCVLQSTVGSATSLAWEACPQTASLLGSNRIVAQAKTSSQRVHGL